MVDGLLYYRMKDAYQRQFMGGGLCENCYEVDPNSAKLRFPACECEVSKP